ncbi:hypothetical protein [Methylobacterium bullatum]
MARGRHLDAAARARQATDRIGDAADAKRKRALALWGLTDIWGVPLE